MPANDLGSSDCKWPGEHTVQYGDKVFYNWVTRAEFIAELRKSLGTAFMHQGRLPGQALDCAGLLECAMVKLGLLTGFPTADENDQINYPPTPDGEMFEKICNQVMDRIEIKDAREGDVLVFYFQAFKKHWQHLAVITDNSGPRPKIIHAYRPPTEDRMTRKNEKVVEHDLDPKWARWVGAAFRIRGLVD